MKLSIVIKNSVKRNLLIEECTYHQANQFLEKQNGILNNWGQVS